MAFYSTARELPSNPSPNQPTRKAHTIKTNRISQSEYCTYQQPYTIPPPEPTTASAYLIHNPVMSNLPFNNNTRKNPSENPIHFFFPIDRLDHHYYRIIVLLQGYPIPSRNPACRTRRESNDTVPVSRRGVHFNSFCTAWILQITTR